MKISVQLVQPGNHESERDCQEEWQRQHGRVKRAQAQCHQHWCQTVYRVHDLAAFTLFNLNFHCFYHCFVASTSKPKSALLWGFKLAMLRGLIHYTGSLFLLLNWNFSHPAESSSVLSGSFRECLMCFWTILSVGIQHLLLSVLSLVEQFLLVITLSDHNTCYFLS